MPRTGTGNAYTHWNNLPPMISLLSDPFQSTLDGLSDAFVSVLNPTASAFVYSNPIWEEAPTT